MILKKNSNNFSGERKTPAATKSRIKTFSWSITRFLILACLSYIILYPVFYMISMALRPIEQVFDPMVVWIPRSLTFDNIAVVSKVMDYKTVFINTASISLLCSLFTLISCSLAGYGFARFNFKLKPLLFGCVILSILIPPQTIIVPSVIEMKYFDFMFIGQLGKLFTGEAWTQNLLNTPFSLYIPAIFGNGIRSGLFIYIFRQFFRGLPVALQDAAYVDGCGQLKTYVKIMAPNALPAFLVVFLFSFVNYWNDFYYSNMYFDNFKVVSRALRTLQVSLNQAGYADLNQIAVYLQVGALLSVLPPLILYLFCQRYFTEGISTTGIVG